MRRFCIAYSLAVLSLVVVVYGMDAETISFSTVKEVEAARLHLKAKGVWKFVDEALSQGVTPPRMHSKYWVDKLPVTNQPQESAFRDFGYEVAVQLNNVALEFYNHPSGDEEVGRVKRLLRLAAWLRQPGGYENYRIARRAEGAAGMLLARVIRRQLDEAGFTEVSYGFQMSAFTVPPCDVVFPMAAKHPTIWLLNNRSASVEMIPVRTDNGIIRCYSNPRRAILKNSQILQLPDLVALKPC